MSGLRLAVGQVRVFPAEPERNAATLLAEIEGARARGVDLLAFPEMAVPGYLLGDLWEDEGFLRAVLAANEVVRAATAAGGPTVVWGSLAVDPGARGTDGRPRKLNAAFVAERGQVLAVVPKTLLPRYRFFDDPRHYVSARQLAEEGRPLAEVLRPVEVLRAGRAPLRLGVLLCEDMWDADYPVRPARILAAQGVDLFLNLSASPWTWQKNRKRREVAEALLRELHVPLVYVNATGVQNNGKNLVVFDGVSAVHAADGALEALLPMHEAATADIVIGAPAQPIAPPPGDDAQELFAALRAALAAFFETVPPPFRRAVVGVSGGIDSATVLALCVHLLGPARVLAVSMPTRFNGPTTRRLGAELCANLGVELLTVPIDELVEATARATGIASTDAAFENVQARTRGQVLASLAQQRQGFFTCNGNKVELAFGYATLHGDLAGAVAPLGDLVKREVRQLADHLNREVFAREVIPRECIALRPSAELSAVQAVEAGGGDPFDYGTLEARGYHDEMVRAFTEFRRGPEWFLEQHLAGRLEETLLLAPGRLVRLFPTPHEFVDDLEKRWRQFFGAVFKRVQAPPIPIVSRRAFGFDLRESLLPAPFGPRFRDLRRLALARASRRTRLAVYGGSFNPPCRHHRQIAERLAARFQRVVVVPCGVREDKASTGLVAPRHRRRMAELAFGGLAGVELDLTDLERAAFTPTVELDARWRAAAGEAELWHVVGGDLVAGGAAGASAIQRTWKQGAELWARLRWAVLTREGSGFQAADLPPQAELLDVSDLVGSSTVARGRLARGLEVSRLLDPAVEEYVRGKGLYSAAPG